MRVSTSITHASAVVFFFFKQKTAYEMRISDWSSDVCSSDLAFPKRTERGQEPARGKLDRRGQCHRRPPRRGHKISKRPVEHIEEIGRASCRERVCQSV